jgi:hypothetical protein
MILHLAAKRGHIAHQRGCGQAGDRQSAAIPRESDRFDPAKDGLLETLSDKEVRDLFAYLAGPAQVPLPKEKSEGP